MNEVDMSVSETPSVLGSIPKRSTTFPQIHNVLTSCLGRRDSHAGNSQYEMLRPASLASQKAASSLIVANSVIDNPSPTTRSSKCIPPSPSTSSFAHHHIHHQRQQQLRVQVSAQIENCAPDTKAKNSLDTGSSRSTHTQHKQQRLARNRRQSPNQLQQHKKRRPGHMQRYSSLSYHRHTRLHQAIKHTLWPTQKRLPVTRGGPLYKSHSIHAIPCSEPTQHLSAGTPESSQSQCQVQIQVQRVNYYEETESHDALQWNRPANENA